ncbi:hypothetical protein CERSUDRAFT_110730 [Gelatoporia subvermispora B]|uniref:BZIP domain-containing protein n=1 Tax=Ceriporiopsis subvermispora (strain B) TaxID=914234 RepID=M2RCL5_CERS8|nr:hypothetical protein CERSUDRAFT_110730 [Gelatoporia subvermispora B]
MSTAIPSPVVSSSSTVWATASKDWVIPAKPKPGRKPKKDVAVIPEDSEVDSKGRRVQNRAAQRAFRERKQSQLAELQARLQQYEQGEIERNVALQNIAKRLKEENDKLRVENTLLKEKLAQAEARAAANDAKKRSRDVSPRSSGVSAAQARKKAKGSTDTITGPVHAFNTSIPYAPSPSSSVSSPGSNASSHSSYSPMPALPPQRDDIALTQGNMSTLFDFTSNGKSMFEPGGPLETFDCGLCSDNSPCVCREIAMQQMSERMAQFNQQPLKSETVENKAPLMPLDYSSRMNSMATVQSMQSVQQHMQPVQMQSSILDNLPAYQPPVPLRRRAPNPAFQPVFPFALPQAEPPQPTVPSCSGDPSNCLACADDAFGKAFCNMINQSVASSQCGDCPSRTDGGAGAPSVGGCCGNPASCGGGVSDGANGGMFGGDMTQTGVPPCQQSSGETIPCDDAWRQIKSHPNVAFADLSLLAEVVARRSKCTGPTVEISPAPGSITPERGLSPAAMQSFSMDMDSQAVLLTDPHAQYHEQQQVRIATPSSPPRLVPQEVLIRCGRQRVREVMADGVRDALRLLDAKFSMP